MNFCNRQCDICLCHHFSMEYLLPFTFLYAFNLSLFAGKNSLFITRWNYLFTCSSSKESIQWHKLFHATVHYNANAWMIFISNINLHLICNGKQFSSQRMPYTWHIAQATMYLLCWKMKEHSGEKKAIWTTWNWYHCVKPFLIYLTLYTEQCNHTRIFWAHGKKNIFGFVC